MIKWLFFDLGSTLIDESECIRFRLSELAKQENAPSENILEKRMNEYAAMNHIPYKETAEEFNLQTIKWPSDMEKIYKDTIYVLKKLSKKYRLGIIANQSSGTKKRLIKYGIIDYFDIIISSSEAGVSKPNPQIFTLALSKAACSPQEAYMIGDRLDNDIEPAAELGMKTIWVKQGLYALGNPNLIKHKPDITVDKIRDILSYL